MLFWAPQRLTAGYSDFIFPPLKVGCLYDFEYFGDKFKNTWSGFGGKQNGQRVEGQNSYFTVSAFSEDIKQ
jgi:hypothetical protein